MKPTTEDVLKWAWEVKAGLIKLFQEPTHTFTISQLQHFAALAYAAGAADEREECAGVEVNITVPHRDYSDMSPKEIYEEALMDATISFRNTIRAMGEKNESN